MSQNSTVLQKSIQLYAIVAILISVVTVSIVSITPFYRDLREIEKRDLKFARDSSAGILNEFFSRTIDIASQISSRTQAKMLLESWINKPDSRQETELFLAKILKAALGSSNKLVSISRFDSQGKLVTRVGTKVNGLLPKQFDISRIRMLGPIQKGTEHYISVVSPIVSDKQVVMGSDVSVFNISRINSIVNEKLQFRLGKIVIAYIHKNDLKILSPVSSVLENIILDNMVIKKDIMSSLMKGRQGFSESKIKDEQIFIAYAALSAAPKWGVAVIIEKSVLFAKLQSNLITVVLIVALLTVIYILGLVMILKPLSGRILLDNMELEAAIENAQLSLKKLNRKLAQASISAPLTNALNRRGLESVFEKELSRAKRDKTSFGLFYIDIDKFKLINDTYGHKAGDNVLKNLATEIKNVIRLEDYLVRVGGDEFVILTPNVDQDCAERICRKLEETTSRPIYFNGQSIDYDISIGYAIYNKQDDNMETMLFRADSLMYQHKKGKP